MAEDYMSYILTDAGSELMARILAGTNVIFKRFAIGDGYEYNMDNYLTKTALVHEVLSVPVDKMTIENNDIISLIGEFSSSQLQDSFWYREIGLYAVDPQDETKEILYAYGNCNDLAEFITPHVANKQILKEIELKISVGASSNVRIYINNNEALNLYDFSADEWVFNSALGLYVLNTGQQGVGLNVFKKTDLGNVIVEFVDIVINSQDILTLHSLDVFDGYLVFS